MFMRAVYTIAASIQIAIGICGPGETYACANSTRPKMLRALDMRAMMTNKRVVGSGPLERYVDASEAAYVVLFAHGEQELGFGAR